MARELGSKHPKKAESEANCTIHFPVYFHYRLESFSILIKQSVHLLRMLFCCSLSEGSGGAKMPTPEEEELELEVELGSSKRSAWRERLAVRISCVTVTK